MAASEEQPPPPPVTEEEDDEHDTKERVLQKYFVQEWKLVKSLLDDIVSSGRVTDPSSVHKIRSILDKYQQQGELLEPYLESIVSPLMFIIRTKTTELGVVSDEILEVIKPLCIVVYTLVTVCGYKSVIRFFPHQVSDLELAVSLLEKCHGTASGTSLRQESTGEMEAKCVVLLWLSILVLVPFDISSVDSTIVDGDGGGGNKNQLAPLVMRILEFSKDYLSSAGPMRTIAGLVLSRLLARPDMPLAFSSFVEWTHEVLSSGKDDTLSHFRLLGAVEALAAIFKSGRREALMDVVPVVWGDVLLLSKSGTAARSPLLRKYLVKLAQRIGFTCLPHRLPTWRYVGRTSSLGENVSQSEPKRVADGSHKTSMGSVCGEESANSLEDEDMDVPDNIEEIIELLLSGLRDTDTVVRWSAAKGIGRITSRLTSALADEVLSSVLELFSPGEGDGSWHGGCLALAELARRGLLLPTSLPRVVPFIVKEKHLHYIVDCCLKILMLISSQHTHARMEIAYDFRIANPTSAQLPMFCAGVLDSLAVELKGSKDFTKLYAGIAILGYIASVSDPVNARAFSHLLFLLAHRYPKIRKASAEQVYLVLLQNGDLVPEDKLDKALEIISETCWDGDIEAAKNRRSELFEIAGLDSAMVKTAGKVSNKNDTKCPTTNDENSSYSALVGSSGF
ncbi:hypothetical protein Tsubulata_038530, partial [Turnera subulata]